MTAPFELDPLLLEVIACPQCHSSLTLNVDDQEFACDDASCGLVYPIRDGIPVLLIDEARSGDSRTSRSGDE